jgi:hypothetical protein
MICGAWEGAPRYILYHSKWRRIEKELPYDSTIGMIGDEPVYLTCI